MYLTQKQLSALEKLHPTGYAALKRHMGDKLVEAGVAARNADHSGWISGPNGTKMYELTPKGRMYLERIK